MTSPETSPLISSADKHLRPARRRAQERPEPGEQLSLERPEVKEVMEVTTGTHLSVAEVMGTDYDRLIQLRMAVRTQMRKGEPLYQCSLCGVAVHICRARDKPKFFFRHQHEDGNCPAQTKGALSEEEINARKYNGAKESLLHRRMKDWVYQCLTIDGRFENIAKEPTWKGALTGERRRPDVRATLNGLPIAFEIQLSTTYLNVISARRDFYMQEGGLLVWLFAEFDTDHRRMTDDDVFYNNNLNAFVVNAKTVENSLEEKAFQLECIWVHPIKGGGHSGLHRRQISFHELTLDPSKQYAYFFDYDAAKQQIQNDAEEEKCSLREEVDLWIGDGGYYQPNSNERWKEFRFRFRKQGIELPLNLNEFDRPLLMCLYSAKHNKPWGQGYKKLVEVAHRVATTKWHHLKWFMHAVRFYGHLQTMQMEGNPERWQRRYKKCREEYERDPTPFEPAREYQTLVEFLFPELLPLP